MSRIPPLVVVVGETASGKSALGLDLAECFHGEIICADSRTVYRGMDIGTAKPTAEERRRIAHHCLDLVDPNEPFNVADFKRQAQLAIEDISSRGKLPIMVGGTGLYIDSILYDYAFRAPADQMERARLSQMSVEELQMELLAKGITLPENPKNPRHLSRAIETGGALSTRGELRANTLVLGLQLDRDVLNARIEQRIAAMVQAGLVDEVRSLGETYGWEILALQAPGYKAFREYLAGRLDLEEAQALFAKNDRNLAKRQRTWFRRNNSVHWLNNRDKIAKSVDLVTTLLNN